MRRRSSGPAAHGRMLAAISEERCHHADVPLLGSSDAKQSDFFADAIDAWSAIDGARMPFVNLFSLHDFTQKECDSFGDYHGNVGPGG